jgi:hypothetical protein
MIWASVEQLLQVGGKIKLCLTYDILTISFSANDGDKL